MFKIRLNDRNGSHYVDQQFDDIKAAGLYAMGRCGGREMGAEVIRVDSDTEGTRVAEFFEGRDVFDGEVKVPVYGR